jgi:phytoene dehydrogenase-like protein
MARIVIVGGGVSGLSAGIYGLMSGHEVTICEKNRVAGGNLTGWRRGEYYIDNCIHWLTGTNERTDGYRRWEALGALGGVKIHQGESLFTVEADGDRLSLWRDLTRLERDMLRLSPEDAGEIKRLVGAIRAASLLSGADGKRGAWERAATIPRLAYYYPLSTGALARKFRNPLLKRFIIGFLGERFGALGFIVMAATFTSGNGGIPEGGSLAMAERMARRFVSLGGDLRLSARVGRIITEGKRASAVILSDAERIEADAVIIATDPAAAFGKIICAPMPRGLEWRCRGRGLERFSSFHQAFACKGNAGFSADVLIDVPREYRSVIKSDLVLLREFSHEPSSAPRGEVMLQAMEPCTEAEATADICLYASDKAAYREAKRSRAAAVEYLITESLPELKRRITLVDAWGPSTYKRYTGAPCGAYMASCLPAAYLPRRAKSRAAGFENLYVATQWQSLPGGLPTAADCGIAAIYAINKDMKVEGVGENKTAITVE